MKQVFSKLSGKWRLAVMGLLVVMVVAGILFSPFGSKVQADDDAGRGDLSLYNRASEVARAFAFTIAPNPGEENYKQAIPIIDDSSSVGTYLRVGNVGGLLGYTEALSDDDVVSGWLSSNFTTASAVITYEQLRNIHPEINAGNDNPFYAYGKYGEALTHMGLIKTDREQGGMGRGFATFAMETVYLAAQAAPFIMSISMTMLVIFNPFRLFDTVIDGMGGMDIPLISQAASFVGDIYETIRDFSATALLPLLLVITAVSLIMFKKGNALQKMGRYAVRVFFIFAGLPLIGATYTGLIEDLDQKVSVGADYADYLVMSSYVDFENWVRETRLAPPGEDLDAGLRVFQINDESEDIRSVPSRKQVLYINARRAGMTQAETLMEKYGDATLSDTFSTADDRQTINDDASFDKDAKETINAARDMMSRHRNSAMYGASEYNGEVIGQIQRIRDKKGASDEAITRMFSVSSRGSSLWSDTNDYQADWSEANGLFVHSKTGESVSSNACDKKGPVEDCNFYFEGFPTNIYNAGGISYEGGVYVSHLNSDASTPLKPIDSARGESSPNVGGLSPLAMYNFLNTKFTETGMTIYSPDRSASDMTRESYLSVRFSGSGIMAFMRWTENVAVMLSLASISLFYGMALVSAAIQNIPRILSGVFGTALGSIAFITKLLISVALLILQVLGVIFLYLFAEYIVMAVLLNMDDLATSATGFFGGTGTIAEFVRSLMTIIIIVAITVFMIKNIKVFRNLMEEVVTSAINRVMSMLDTSTGGKNGVDMAKTSGGRVGKDGKLGEHAANEGAFDNVGGKQIAGAKDLFNAAHDHNKRKENAQELAGQGKTGKMESLKNTFGTAGQMAKAQAKDKAASVTGLGGGNTDRLQSKLDRERDLTAWGRNQIGDSSDDAGHQYEDGEMMMHANGEDAIDADGNAISPEAGAAFTGKDGKGKAQTDANGRLLNTDGEGLSDENGNALYADKNGKLINEDGDYVSIHDDGVARPLKDGEKPVNATRAAQDLNNKRFDSEEYKKMKQAQGAPSAGMDREGHAVDENGEQIELDKGGTADFDEEGYLIDTEGNRVSASDLKYGTKLDDDAYETVEDPETGEEVLRHKEADAQKPVAGVDTKLDPATAKQAKEHLKHAEKQHDKAQKSLDKMKENGASPYAIAQAEARVAKTAQAVEKAKTNVAGFSNSDDDTTSGGSGKPSTSPIVNNASTKVPTSEEVAQTKSESQSAQAAVKSETAILEQLEEDGAPPEVVEQQQAVVDGVKEQAHEVNTKMDNQMTAQNTGRSERQVAETRHNLDTAQAAFTKATVDYDQAVASGASPNVIKTKQQAVEKASGAYSKATEEMTVVRQKPKTPSKAGQARIDASKHELSSKRSTHQAEKRKLQTMKRQGKPHAEIKTQEAVVDKAGKSVQKANSTYQKTVQTETRPSGYAPVMNTTASQSNVSQGYTVLSKQGVTNRQSYDAQMQKTNRVITKGKAQMRSLDSQIQHMKDTGQPPQVIQKKVDDRQFEQKQVMDAVNQQQSLKNNAHGLQQVVDYQPQGVAEKPIRENGVVVQNKVVELAQTQQRYNAFARQQKAGTLQSGDEKTMQSLAKRMTGMRGDLRKAGIREDALKDMKSLNRTTQTLQKSWTEFTDGSSTTTS